MQGAFFNSQHPKYLNYAGIGFAVGHEITHAFDDEGRKFDKNGNLNGWWDPETEKEYLKKSECMIKQYSSYTVEEVNLNVSSAIIMFSYLFN